MSRNDLTNWVIHFVHRRNSESHDYEEMRTQPPPDNFTFEGKPIFQTIEYEEEDYGLSYDACAMSVLNKILHDGIIKTGWSFRKGKSTIYGPKSAACFTEMPLYALIEYSKSRNNKNYIEPYGIAFMKEELFEAGARPVIYGLSKKHSEAIKGDKNYGIGLRSLSSNCGIGLEEMYRYVYTDIRTDRRIDWTHEREWRWADLEERFDFAGMPFIAKNKDFKFSKVIVIVKEKSEVEEVIKHLQNLYHSQATNFSRAYNLNVISKTYVLSIEDLSEMKKDILSIKLDDLPLNSIPKLKPIIVSDETKEKVKSAIKEASNIYYREAERVHKLRGDVGMCGWANVVTHVADSEITQALVDLEIARSYGKGYYNVRLEAGFPAQSMYIDEAGKNKAAEYLTKELGQNFSIRSKRD